jgi:hypothetical protein
MFLWGDERWDRWIKQPQMSMNKSVLAISLMLTVLMVLGVFGKNDFIYFQF